MENLDLGNIVLLVIALFSLFIVKQMIATLCKTVDRAVAELSGNAKMVMAYKATEAHPNLGPAMLKESNKLEPRPVELREPIVETTGTKIRVGAS